MSKVFNMVGGGGGKNISSIIISGLESNDTVTCTKDGKSYPATWDETAQHWEVVGLPFGTFTLTATNGTKTTTETVLIDIAGVYEIEMSLNFYLYNKGDECEDVTGGWTANGYTRNGYTVYAGTKESDALKVSLSSSSGSQVCLIGTNIPIDFSGYSKCCIEYLVSATDQYNPTIATKTTKSAESTALFAKYGSSNFTANVTKILEIDISSVNGSGYFEWYCTNVATHRIYRVWLE